MLINEHEFLVINNPIVVQHVTTELGAAMAALPSAPSRRFVASPAQTYAIGSVPGRRIARTITVTGVVDLR